MMFILGTCKGLLAQGKFFVVSPSFYLGWIRSRYIIKITCGIGVHAACFTCTPDFCGHLEDNGYCKYMGWKLRAWYD